MPAGAWWTATSAGWYMAGHGLRLCIGLLVGLYVARYLGPESFGELSFSLSFVYLFGSVANLGLQDVAVRDLVARPERAAATLGAVFCLRLTSGAGTVALILVAAWITQADPTIRLLILIIAGALLIENLNVTTLWFQAQVLARPIVVSMMLAMITGALLRVALVLLGEPVVWFAVATLVEASLLAAIVLAWFLLHGGPALRRWRMYRSDLADLWARAWPLALSSGIVNVQVRIDQVMVGMMRGGTEVGLYAAAVRLSDVWQFIPYAIGLAVLPAIVAARRSDRRVYLARVQAVLDLLLWLGLAMAVPTTLLAKPIVILLFGEAFSPSATIVRIQAWTFVFACVGYGIRQWILAEGLVRIALVMSVIGVVLNVALNLLLVPLYGGPGAAWATLTTAALVLLAHFVYRPTRTVAAMVVRAGAAPVRWSLWLARQRPEA